MPAGLPDDVPEAFAEANKNFHFGAAEPLKAAVFDRPIRISGANPRQLQAAWSAVQAKAARVRDHANDPTVRALGSGGTFPIDLQPVSATTSG
jgi:hypothetical protein